MAQFDDAIAESLPFHFRNVDDITALPTCNVTELLATHKVNKLHLSLKVTYELEETGSLSFLDIFVTREDRRHLRHHGSRRKWTVKSS